MIPGNVVFVAFSFPPNRRFYKEIISYYQAKLFSVVLNATGERNNVHRRPKLTLRGKGVL